MHVVHFVFRRDPFFSARRFRSFSPDMAARRNHGDVAVEAVPRQRQTALGRNHKNISLEREINKWLERELVLFEPLVCVYVYHAPHTANSPLRH